MAYVAKSEYESSQRVVAIALRKACPMALGMLHNFVQGPKPHSLIYYNKKTVIGAHYGGVKVVGWHLPGFKLRAKEPASSAASDSMLGAWEVEGLNGESQDEDEDDVAESGGEDQDESDAGPSAAPSAVAGDDSDSD